MGRIHSQRADRLARASHVESGMDRRRQRHRRRLRERAGDLVRRAGSLDRQVEAAGRLRRLDRGQAARIRREPPACRRDHPLGLQRALPPDERLQLHRASICRPTSHPTASSGVEAGVWTVRLIGRGDSRRPLPLLDRARRSVRARPCGRQAALPLSLVLLRALERRFRTRSARSACGHRVIVGRQPRRCAPAHQQSRAARVRPATTA